MGGSKIRKVRVLDRFKSQDSELARFPKQGLFRALVKAWHAEKLWVVLV